MEEAKEKTKRVLPIPVTEASFFRAYVDILQPFNNLRKRDADVFGEILYQAHLIKHVDEKYRFKLLFDYETRLKMEANLGISSANLRNSISNLRKKNLILPGNRIPNYYLIDPEDGISIEFNFIIKPETVLEDGD